MLFKSVFALAAASVALAATPQGFSPATESPLMVSFSGIDASGGKQVAKEGKLEPTILLIYFLATA